MIFITTRHDTHSNLIVESLNSGKNVFVEKPLCIVKEDIKKIEKENYRDAAYFKCRL